MVNTNLFKTFSGKNLPQANTKNNSNALAYALGPRHQLAQLAATGCLSQTFYANAQSQLDTVLDLAKAVDASFVAKTAIYAREAGYMKDMPALLSAVLAVRDVELLTQVFGRVINNGKMLRNFVQILRSGAVGRKSLGTRPKKLVQQWLLNASEKQLLNAAVGNNPTLADVVKMVHPKAPEPWRNAWFAWLIGREYNFADLPPITQAFEQFKQALRDGQPVAELPDVPFQMLTALPLSDAHWATIACKGSWQMVRQNLNTFARHGVFEDDEMAQVVAEKLRDAKAIANANVMPYQLMSAYKMTGDTVPQMVREALQDAMEMALANVPMIQGQIVVCPDISGSMQSPATGYRTGATSTVRCLDVAALVAAAIVRKNPQAQVLPFENVVRNIKLNPRDSVMTNANKLANMPGGGTNVSAPLAWLNKDKTKVDLVVLVSDNESWVDNRRHGSTQTMREWAQIKMRNPNAKMVCIDIQPYTTTQAHEQDDIMNIGGFSDAVFDRIANFAQNYGRAGHWVDMIEAITLNPM